MRDCVCMSSVLRMTSEHRTYAALARGFRILMVGQNHVRTTYLGLARTI